MEYVKVWMQQSALFWSRLQWVALLQTGVFTAWFNLRQLQGEPDVIYLVVGILGIGGLLSLLLHRIMVRDAAYMEAMRQRAGLKVFPEPDPEESVPNGQKCAHSIVWALIAADVALIFWTFHQSAKTTP